MDSYGLLYTTSFKCLNGDSYDMWIEKKNYVGSSSSITLSSSPIIKYDELKKEYEFVFSSGIEFSLNSSTDRQFINLYTNDIQLYRIELFKNTQYCGCYFLDTETYSEDFSILSGYDVNLTANNGLKLLQRYSYVDTSGYNYTGVQSLWDVLSNCLKKINFYSQFIYVNINTTISGITNSSSQTTLHNTYVKSSNWYNEENEPMNCYDVLKSILQSYQAYIFQDYLDGRFYLIDKITLSNSSNTYKYYDMQGYNYQGQTVITTNSYDISTIKMANNTSTFEKVNAINGQKLNYSQYATDNIFKYSASVNDFSNSATTVMYSPTSTDFKWQETYYTSGNTFTLNNAGTHFVKMEGKGSRNLKEYDYYIKIDKNYFDIGNHDVVLLIKNPLEFTNWTSGKYRLKIEMNAYCRTKDKLGDDTETPKKIHACYWGLILRVGDKQYRYNTWGNIPTEEEYFGDARWCLFNAAFFGDAKLSVTSTDQWITNNQVKTWGGDLVQNEYSEIVTNINIPMPSTLSGDFYLGITNMINAVNYGYDAFYETYMNPYLDDVRLKSITLTVVDLQGNIIDTSDILYEAKLDMKNSTSGTEIKQLLGTNVKELPIAKGSLMYLTGSTYNYIQNWVRSGSTDCLERLNLNNIVNTYQNVSNSLSCTTNIIPSLLSVITYNNYLTGKYMICDMGVYLEDSITQIKIKNI